MEYVIENTKPTPDEFLLLHSKVGWGATDIEMASASLNHSLFHVTARVGTKLIGMGRVIGDGSMFFYVQEEYQIFSKTTLQRNQFLPFTFFLPFIKDPDNYQ